MPTVPPPVRPAARRPLRVWATVAALAVLVGVGAGTLAARAADPSALLERARDLALAGQPEDALRQLHRALAQLGEQGDPTLRRRALVRAAQLTDLHLGAGRVNEALEWYRRIVAEFPDSTEAFDAGVRIAEILKQRFDDDARASAELVRVVDAFPGHTGAPRLLLRAARMGVDARRYDEARELARRLVTEWPESDEAPEAHAVVASTLHLQGHHADAVKAWSSMAERFPGTPHAARALAESGHCLEEQFDYVHAIARYVESLPRHPDPFAVQKRLERVRKKFSAEQAKEPGSRAVAFR